MSKIATQQHLLRQRQSDLGKYLQETMRSERNSVVEELVNKKNKEQTSKINFKLTQSQTISQLGFNGRRQTGIVGT